MIDSRIKKEKEISTQLLQFLICFLLSTVIRDVWCWYCLCCKPCIWYTVQWRNAQHPYHEQPICNQQVYERTTRYTGKKIVKTRLFLLLTDQRLLVNLTKPIDQSRFLNLYSALHKSNQCFYSVASGERFRAIMALLFLFFIWERNFP